MNLYSLKSKSTIEIEFFSFLLYSLDEECYESQASNSIFVVVIIITTILQLVGFKVVIYHGPNLLDDQPKVMMQIKAQFDWITQN